MTRTIASITLAIIVAGCTPQTTWRAPPNTSGREAIRDRLVCRALSKSDYIGTMDGFGNLALALNARNKHDECMREAGFIAEAH